MRFTVIIPIYNSEKTLSRCVDSVLDGNFDDFELILVDDGSTDSSNSLCREYAARDSRVKVLSQLNQGAAVARNLGLDHANGEYVGFLDSDDCVSKDYMSSVDRYLLSGIDADVIWFNIRAVTESGSELFVTTNPLNFRVECGDYLGRFYGMNLSIGSMCSKFYRRAALIHYGIKVDESCIYGEDWDFNLRLAEKSISVATIPDVLYRYVKYQSCKTISTSYFKRDFEVMCESYLRLESIRNLRHLSIPTAEQDSIFIYNVISHIQKMLTSTLSAKEKKQEFRSIVTNSIVQQVFNRRNWRSTHMSRRQHIGALFLSRKLLFAAKTILSI